jgi:hypothetical protein
MKKIKIIAPLLVGLCLLVGLFATPVLAQVPPLPHAFYGTVKINDSPAPIGTEVEAEVEGVVTGEGNPITVTEAGKYGGPGGLDPKLVVQGDIEDGATITFYVNGVAADQTAEWNSGEVTELNLTATIPMPTVTSVSPASGATNVSVSTVVTATFNMAMNASTITTSSFTLKVGTTLVSGSVSYNSATYTATFTPSANLAYNTIHTATLSTAITNTYGMPLASAYSWSFTTEADIYPPTVIRTSPRDGARGVAVTTKVTATFSEPVNEGTIVFTLDSVSGTVSYSDNTATFAPDADLDYITTYSASIQASDLAGNPMTEAYTWSFRTEVKPAAAPPPEEEEEGMVPPPELGPRVSVGNLRISPDQVSPNQPVTVSISVFNAGDRGGSKTLNLLINDEFEQSTQVGVPAHASKSVSFTVSQTNPGIYSVYIEGASGWFTVLQAVEPSAPVEAGLGTGGLIGIVIIAIVLIAGITFAFLYIRRSA